MDDYYAILEVHPKASPEVIKKAFLVLAKKYHPDTTSLPRAEAEKKMVLLNKAYKVLLDPDARRAYDNLVKEQAEKADEAAAKEAKTEKGQTAGKPRMSEEERARYYAQELSKTCIMLISSIKSRLRFSPGNEERNEEVLEKFINIVVDRTFEYVRYLEKSPYKKRDDFKPVFLVYCQLALGYTHTNDKQMAIIMLGEALAYFDEDDAICRKAKVTLARLEREEAEAAKAKEVSPKPEDTPAAGQKPGPSKFKIWYSRVCLFIVVCIAIAACSSSPSKTPKTSPKASPAKQSVPAATAPKAANAQTKSPQKQFIPKKGVISQYVPGAPQKNTSGYSVLKFDNSKNSAPVYVRLWTTGAGAGPVRTFTVASGSIFTAENLTPGTYEIRYKYLFENGVEGSAIRTGAFTLTERRVGQDIEYQIRTFSLTPVKHGNTWIQSIPASDI